jgi:hypothetical protein
MMEYFGIGARRWPGVSKLVEEAGETLQIVGKFMQTPDGDHWDNRDGGVQLKERFQMEIADLRAAIDFVIKHGEFDKEALMRRYHEKLAKFELWHATDNVTVRPR